MKLNIACPETGLQKFIDIDDEKKLRALYDKRISQEVSGDDLGEEFKGYIFRISGGNDKEGFAMKQGVMSNHRVRLLLKKGLSSYRPRRVGERKRKSVRGCIVGPDLSVLNLVVLKRGEQEVAGLTDSNIPRRLGPKRASKIRKLFGLTKTDDVTKFAIQRKFEKKGKTVVKSAKIQRLITPIVLKRKRVRIAEKKVQLEKSKEAAAKYHKMVQQKFNEQKEARRTVMSKKRSDKVPKTEAPTTAKDTKAPVVAKDTKPTVAPVTKDTKTTAKDTKVAPVAKDTKPVAKETKPVAKDTKATVKETKPVAKDTKTTPAPKETKPSTAPVTKETKPAPKETKTASAPAPKETKTASAPKPAPKGKADKSKK